MIVGRDGSKPLLLQFSYTQAWADVLKRDGKNKNSNRAKDRDYLWGKTAAGK